MTMRYTVYRTQNIANGRYYFGVHKTRAPYDGYLGSGTILMGAVKKYGKQAFIKNVCFVFDNAEEACAKEFELIETYREDPLCYNLRQGGSGGFDYINTHELRQGTPYLGKTHSKESKKLMSDTKKGKPSPFINRYHTEGARAKNRKAHTINLQGQHFGDVTAISIVSYSSTRANWRVKCGVCGEEGIVRSSRVLNGDSSFMKQHNTCEDPPLQMR